MPRETTPQNYVNCDQDLDAPHGDIGEKDSLLPTQEEGSQHFPSPHLPTRDQGFIEGGKGAGPATIFLRDGRTMYEQRSPTAVRVILDEASTAESMQRVPHGVATAESPRLYALKARRTLTPQQTLHQLQGDPIPRRQVATLSIEEAKAREQAVKHKGKEIPVDSQRSI